MKARSLPLYYFSRNKIDNNMLHVKISETFWLITVLLRPCYTRQFFLQLVSQQALRDKLQERFHV